MQRQVASQSSTTNDECWKRNQLTLKQIHEQQRTTHKGLEVSSSLYQASQGQNWGVTRKRRISGNRVITINGKDGTIQDAAGTGAGGKMQQRARVTRIDQQTKSIVIRDTRGCRPFDNTGEPRMLTNPARWSAHTPRVWEVLITEYNLRRTDTQESYDQRTEHCTPYIVGLGCASTRRSNTK